MPALRPRTPPRKPQLQESSGKGGPEPGCHPKKLGSQAQLTSHLSKLGAKSYLLQVDSRRWPALLAPTHSVPSHMLQRTALVHLYLGRRRNQVSPHQALGREGNAQVLTQSQSLYPHPHAQGREPHRCLSWKHLPMSDLCSPSLRCLCHLCGPRLSLSLWLPSGLSLPALIWASAFAPQSTANM